MRATLALGDARPVLDAAAALVDTARSARHAPTLAEAELLHADVLRATSQLDAAVDAVRSAAANAERGHADQLSARIWLARVAIAGDRRDLASADDLIAIASGAIDRAGSSRRLVATLYKHRGLVAYNRGNHDEARALLQTAHEMLSAAESRATRGAASVLASSASSAPTATTAPVALESSTPTSTKPPVSELHPRATITTNPPEPVSADFATTIERIAVESALGSVERAAGDLDSAEQWHQRALDADRALRGDVHPDIARDLHNLAGVSRLRGDLALAFERYSKALEIEIATRGPKSVEAGLTHNSLGLVALARAGTSQARGQGAQLDEARPHLDSKTRTRLDEARVQFTRARDIFVAANHGDRAFAEHNLGLVAAAAGDHRAALAHFDAAAGVYKTTIGSSADAAKRLLDDRATSELALRVAARPRRATSSKTATSNPTTTAVEPTPVTTAIPPAPPVPAPTPLEGAEPPKRDVGVYGSTQTW